MSATQTRRSVSIKGLTYRRLREYCDRFGCSMSEVVELLLHERLALGDAAPWKPLSGCDPMALPRVAPVIARPVVSIPEPTPAESVITPRAYQEPF